MRARCSLRTTWRRAGRTGSTAWRTGGNAQTDWWPEGLTADALGPRYERLEKEWTEYLASATDADLAGEFEYVGTDGKTWWRWSIEGQIVQLVGHAFFHRGQIALLVRDLGGEAPDTDYLYWAYPQNPRYGKIEAPGTRA